MSEKNEWASDVVEMIDEIGEDFTKIRFEQTSKGGKLIGTREDGQQVRSNVFKGFALNRWLEVEKRLTESKIKNFEVILHHD